MGGGGSKTYKTHAEREAERFKKAERARVKLETAKLKQERKMIEGREREAWLRNWRDQGGGGSMGWWSWLSWWKERRAWNAEWSRRKKTGGGGGVDDVLLKPHQH